MSSGCLADPRYGAAQNVTPPKKLGTRLTLFDCMTCDKCIPVCPNDANFVLAIPKGRLAVERLVKNGAGWTMETVGEIAHDKPWQIGVFADACNECGNCDVFCPEDGAPYLSKPLFFGSVAAWQATPARDGFAFETDAGTLRMHGRLNGRAVSVEDKWRSSTLSWRGLRPASRSRRSGGHARTGLRRSGRSCTAADHGTDPDRRDGARTQSISSARSLAEMSRRATNTRGLSHGLYD